ncbi:MAG TPA: hypothetical protein VEQ63_14505, partial [Bryobacteraceae bacterium]|nr:hypothetical protein [Bryobacteraceae bacterium]
NSRRAAPPGVPGSGDATGGSNENGVILQLGDKDLKRWAGSGEVCGWAMWRAGGWATTRGAQHTDM